MPSTIVNRDSMTYHLRENGACPAPRTNDLLFIFVIHLLYLFNKFWFDEGTFF
jgi:hypothetical protein